MNKCWILGFIFVVLLSSCEKKEPFVYQYEENPNYSWGYAEFWGDYYQAYAIPQNVVSLSMFSTHLSVDSAGSLIGTGQYLFLEDVFIAPSDTLLPAGTYTVSTDPDSFTIAPGMEMEVDGQKFEVGAFVYFLEDNEHYSLMKFITAGSMLVNYSDASVRINFDFTLDDKTSIRGSYEGPLPYFDARFTDEKMNMPQLKTARLAEFAFPSGSKRRVR